MRRTWLWSLVLMLSPAVAFAQYGAPLQPQPAPAPAPATAAPATTAPAPPPVGAEPAPAAAVAVDTSAVAAPTGERRGLTFAARLPLNEIPVLNLQNSGATLEMLPRFYGGYQMGKLGILLGLNLINASRAEEGGGGGGEDLERAALGWLIAPGVTYELMMSPDGSLTLAVFGNILFGQQSVNTKMGPAETEEATGTTGIDLGARVTGWLFPALGVGLDVGLTYASMATELTGNEDAGVDEDANQAQNQIIAIYAALQLTTIFLQ